MSPDTASRTTVSREAASPAIVSRDTASSAVTAASASVEVLPLHAEEIAVSKRRRRTLVRAARSTRIREAVVEEDLLREHVVVERVAIGRVVDAVPPVRQEGDVTIMPVVEEVLVLERRLVLKEEVRLRRVRSTERHVETVRLREQDVAVTRVPLGD